MKRQKDYLAASVTARSLALLFVASWLVPRAAEPLQARYIRQEVPRNEWASEAPAQPIPFSHLKHADVADCQTCHANPARGRLMSLPASGTCMECHETLGNDLPAIQKLAQYDRSQEPIPWVRVYTLRPGIAWSHARHLDASVTCATCHGEVAQMDAIAEVTAVTTKAGCLSCHTVRSAGTTCETCHPWPTEGWRIRTAQFGGNPTWP